MSGELFGQLAKKDVGVAYIKGGDLLDFKRLPLLTQRSPATLGVEGRSPFELLTQTGELDELLRYTPSGVRTIVGDMFRMIFGLVLVGVGILIVVGSKRDISSVLFGIFFVVPGVLMAAESASGLVKTAASPLKRIPCGGGRKTDRPDQRILLQYDYRDGGRATK